MPSLYAYHVLIYHPPVLNGCCPILEQLQDMSVKVTTEVAEVEASKTPSDEQGQVRTRVSLCITYVRHHE